MTAPQPPGWQQQNPQAYGPPQEYRPTARYLPQDGQRPPVPRKKRRWLKVVGVLLAVVVLLAGLVAGYLLLAYNRSVGAPPIADPVPEQCTLSATVLARAGTPSWQGGPLFAGDKGRSGVNCRWVAAEEESIRQRTLTVKIVDFESAAAAKKQEKSSSDGPATLVARAGEVVVEVSYTGSDKGFFSPILGDDAETEVSPAEAEAAAQAVLRELLAKVGR